MVRTVDALALAPHLAVELLGIGILPLRRERRGEALHGVQRVWMPRQLFAEDRNDRLQLLP
jgi:hypothetical protein